MYYIKKRMEIAGAHQLNLPYESKCANLHGHNWIVNVYCKSKELTDYGMVIDFNPTAENMAKWICDNVPHCYKVEVQESEGNTATYEVDEQ